RAVLGVRGRTRVVVARLTRRRACGERAQRRRPGFPAVRRGHRSECGRRQRHDRVRAGAHAARLGARADRPRVGIRGVGRRCRRARRTPTGHRRATCPPADRPVAAGRTTRRPVDPGEQETPGMGMTEPLVVGVDGGNSKTDVALATPDGRTLAMVRGPGSSPDKLGDESAAQVITDLVEAVRQEANAAAAPIGRLSAFLAGLDLPEDVPRFSAVLTRRWPEADVHVDNDAMAALLAGTGGTAGVAVVCGAGINAVGLGAAGQRASFRSLGALSGDWGGGLGLGRTVLWHAARAEDGRGPRTRLAELTKQHFDVHSIDEVVMALRTGKLAETRLAELVDELFRADDEADPVAVSVVGRLAEEIAAMTRVMLDRTQLRGTGARVVLAG